ncbi:MAG: hypothetical protein ACLRPT_11490 [Akkermansia muciniphila]
MMETQNNFSTPPNGCSDRGVPSACALMLVMQEYIASMRSED